MKVHRSPVFGTEYTIEFWYDRSAKSWFTMLVDSVGNQIDDALNDGNKDGRDISISWLVKKAEDLHVRQYDFD